MKKSKNSMKTNFISKEGYKIEVSLETISPETAKEYLSRNVNNRKIKKLAKEMYVRDITSDNWVLNGDTICFDVEGNLVDGQHRLLACIEAGKEFETLVVRGVQSKAKDTIDTGVNRTSADILDFEGIPDSNNLTSAVRKVLSFEGKISEYTSGGKSVKYSHSEVISEFKNLKDLYLYANDFSRSMYSRNKNIPRSFIAAMIVYLISRLNYPKEKIETFFTQFVDLEPACSSVRAMRVALSQDSKNNTGKLKPLAKQAIIFRCWNAYSEDRELKTVSYNYERDKNLKLK